MNFNMARGMCFFLLIPIFCFTLISSANSTCLQVVSCLATMNRPVAKMAAQ